MKFWVVTLLHESDDIRSLQNRMQFKIKFSGGLLILGHIYDEKFTIYILDSIGREKNNRASNTEQYSC